MSLRQKILNLFFGCKLAFVLKYKFLRKTKFCMQSLTFCVYNVVQDEFFTQKNQKSQKCILFLNTIIILLFHLLR